MRFLLIPLMWVAGTGLTTGLWVHLCTLWGQVPWGLEPYVLEYQGVLGVGIFVVWLPATLIARRMSPGDRMQFSWRAVLSGCPQWMQYGVYGVFGYTFLNFFAAISQENHRPLDNLRAFSGHWMLFYGMAFAIFYSAWNRPRMLQARACPLGHPVGHADAYCPTCGAPVADAPPLCRALMPNVGPAPAPPWL